jgi:hypothetical protein
MCTNIITQILEFWAIQRAPLTKNYATDAHTNTHRRCSQKIGDQVKHWFRNPTATDNQPTLRGRREREASSLIKRPLIKNCAKRWSPKIFATDNQLIEKYPLDEGRGGN